MEKWEQAIHAAVNPAMPTDIENHIQCTLQQLPRKKRQAKWRYALPAAIAAVCILFGAMAISPAFAATMRTIPVVGSIFEKVGNSGEQQASQQGLVRLFGKQVDIDGTRVTLTESLYDGSSIHIGFINEKGRNVFLIGAQVWINGKQLTDFSTNTSGRTLENGQFAGIATIHPEQAIPDDFTLRLSGSGLQPWQVEIPVIKQGDSHMYLINETKAWRDMTMIYDKIGVYPSSTVLSLRWLMDKQYQSMTPLNYQIFDDQGRVLQPFSAQSQGVPRENSQFVVTSQFSYEPADATAKSLTVKPYLDADSPIGTVTQPWKGHGFELSQGKVGTVTIEQVEQHETTITMTYTVHGEISSQRINTVWIENQYGKWDEEIQQPQRVKGTVNRYQAIYSTSSPKDDIIIGTGQFQPIDYLEDLTVTIDLNR